MPSKKIENVHVLLNMLGCINRNAEDNEVDDALGRRCPAATHQGHIIKLLVQLGGYVCSQLLYFLLEEWTGNLIWSWWLHPNTFSLHHIDHAAKVCVPRPMKPLGMARLIAHFFFNQHASNLYLLGIIILVGIGIHVYDILT